MNTSLYQIGAGQFSGTVNNIFDPYFIYKIGESNSHSRIVYQLDLITFELCSMTKTGIVLAEIFCAAMLIAL